jgi:hypothetical protein
MLTDQSSGNKKLLEWNNQQEKLLKNWGEIAASYRWLHNQTHNKYRKKNFYFMIPLIIMSTVTGTANFAQDTFPIAIRPNVPQIIGAINLISAILTTIYQFLKISEYMESHRIASINYGKFSRNITVELNLPVKNRSIAGNDLVKISRIDIDRLIEQSPPIPNKIIKLYQKEFAGSGVTEPEIIHINKIDIFDDQANKVTNAIADAGVKFKNALNSKFMFKQRKKSDNWDSVLTEIKSKVPIDEPPTEPFVQTEPIEIEIREEPVPRSVESELSELKNSRLVSKIVNDDV